MSTWLTQQQLYARVASIVACALVASACDLGKLTHSHTTEREVGSVLPDAARGYGGSRARIGIVSKRPRNSGEVVLAKRWALRVGLSVRLAGWPLGRLANWATCATLRYDHGVLLCHCANAYSFYYSPLRPAPVP